MIKLMFFWFTLRHTRSSGEGYLSEGGGCLVLLYFGLFPLPPSFIAAAAVVIVILAFKESGRNSNANGLYFPIRCRKPIRNGDAHLWLSGRDKINQQSGVEEGVRGAVHHFPGFLGELVQLNWSKI
jgi:hypothetical protein